MDVAFVDLDMFFAAVSRHLDESTEVAAARTVDMRPFDLVRLLLPILQPFWLRHRITS